jgi:hypothetical protein
MCRSFISIFLLLSFTFYLFSLFYCIMYSMSIEFDRLLNSYLLPWSSPFFDFSWEKFEFSLDLLVLKLFGTLKYNYIFWSPKCKLCFILSFSNCLALRLSTWKFYSQIISLIENFWSILFSYINSILFETR